MPLKDFRRDLSHAATAGQFAHLSGVRAGDCDDSVSFNFTEPLTNSRIDFQAIVSGTDNYPDFHRYFIFATSDSPPEVTAALKDAEDQFVGSSVSEVLESIDKIVNNAVTRPGSHRPNSVPCESQTDTSDENAMFDEGELDCASGSEDEFAPYFASESDLRAMLRHDLRAAKNAGFKVGYLGALNGPIIISVSCRIARLGISEEAMEAWNVRRSDYLVVLIRYPWTYLGLQRILHDRALIQMRVGLCKSYKPSPQDALRAFQNGETPAVLGESSSTSETNCSYAFNPLFIDASLKYLLNERFLGIVSLRLKYGFSWTGAEICFHTSQGKIWDANDVSASEYQEPDTWASTTPALLVSDHMADRGMNVPQLSLPLLVMQFTLRHFVKCTEFCLVCHCKTRDDFEAIKPYVCSNGLCLHQYMELGIGRSLEFEIRAQPYVVDMLVSLTYARAGSGRLEDFPTGLNIRVPDPSACFPNQNTDRQVSKYYSAKLNLATKELHLKEDPCLKVGDWILIFSFDGTDGKDEAKRWHCRIDHVGESSCWLRISSSVGQGNQLTTKALSRQSMPLVKFAVYDQNLDDLTPSQKRETIRMLLDTLPGVDAMQGFLAGDGSGKTLASWQEKIIPAALDLLRWIITSNRSYIAQDRKSSGHLVSGMDGYVQFRLVQGAADKEERFAAAVKAHGLTANAEHPTLFGWHGSPVHNWHSILREGLHFREIVHGRACGNGVYLSNHFSTSLGYTDRHSGPSWPPSILKVTKVVSLNEVVNAPGKFVNSNSCYVVDHLEWIQPRYLFVQCKGDVTEALQELQASLVYKQDPKRQVYGPNGKLLAIPISAHASRRRQNLATYAQKAGLQLSAASPVSKGKKRKRGTKDQALSPPASELMEVDYETADNASVITAVEDREILLSDTEGDAVETSPTDALGTRTSPNHVSKTDFQPGTLRSDLLLLLSSPQYATSSATKVLQQHLQAIMKVQQREHLHELGWYLDPKLITTPYQWIVELHTFDSALPLTRDLKAAGLASIVLELRFPPRFPMSPPFVRVVRPRFLEFHAGGGGHVTAGGAMCMELLTNSGWLPTISIESVLLQVRMAITNTEPNPARLARGRQSMEYSVGEAVEAYKRACLAHGWEIPDDIHHLFQTQSSK